MGGLRSSISVLLALATCVATVAAIGSTWVHHQLIDTDRFGDSTVLVLRDPAVQDVTAQFLADQTVAQLQSSAVASALPAPLQALAGSGLGALARTTALKALRDHAYEPLWRAAATSTHAEFVRWLEGKDTHASGGDVVLDLQPAVDRLARQVGVPAAVVRQAEQATGGARVVLIKRAQYDPTRRDYLRLERLAGLMVPLAIGLALLSIAIAPRRRSAVVRVGVAVGAAGLIVLAATPGVRSNLESGLVDGGAATSVARAIWSAISPELLRTAWITAVAGGAVALAATLTRPRRA